MVKSILTKITIAVTSLALLLGLIGQTKPQIFLQIPSIGFILWTITTGQDLPPYIRKGPFHNTQQSWLKDNDVVVTADAKSGTTWMLFCSHQIRVKGKDDVHPFADVMLSTPWMELIQTPGRTWEDQREEWNTTVLEDGSLLRDYWDHEEFPFRIFKSHNGPQDYGQLLSSASSSSSSSSSSSNNNNNNGPSTNIIPNVKFLAMARNGLDQVASMTPFFNGHTDTFRNMWGGFPPATRGTLREDAIQRLKDMMPGGIFDGMHFKYVNSWWNYKDRDNVLLLHYSDAKKDLEGTVSKIAKFYGVKLNKKEKDTVVKKCSFDYMKQHEQMFGYTLPLNPKYDKTIMETGHMIRKGQNGDGKVMFTEEETKMWAKLEEAQFGDDPVKLNWARNGGAY